MASEPYESVNVATITERADLLPSGEGTRPIPADGRRRTPREALAAGLGGEAFDQAGLAGDDQQVALVDNGVRLGIGEVARARHPDDRHAVPGAQPRLAQREVGTSQSISARTVETHAAAVLRGVEDHYVTVAVEASDRRQTGCV